MCCFGSSTVRAVALILLFASVSASFGIEAEKNLQPVYSLLLSAPVAPKVYPPTTTLSSRATDITIAKPAPGESVADNVFKTNILRVNKSDNTTSSYPKVQSWNSDMSLLRIGSRLYHTDSMLESAYTKGRTGPEAWETLCSRDSDYFRWSNIRPDRFFVINSSHQFIQGQINGNSVDCTTVLDTFGDYEEIHMGPHEGNIDFNDEYVVFAAKKTGDTKFYIILFDIPHKNRVWTKEITDNHWKPGNGEWLPSQIDWISISPSGKYIVKNEMGKNHKQDGLYRYTREYKDPRKLQYEWCDSDNSCSYYSEGGHGDMGFDINGEEVVVQFMAGLGVHSFSLDHPEELGKKLLQSPYGGGHVSCRNSRRKGWCYITTLEEGYKQVFALKLDGTSNETVQNYSQTHIESGYAAYGAPSPDGTRVIFNSNWGNNNGEADTFIVTAQ